MLQSEEGGGMDGVAPALALPQSSLPAKREIHQQIRLLAFYKS